MMSTVQTIESLRPFERALVNGYFLCNFSKYTPSEIINICIFYCFIFDEFDVISPSNVSMKGINNKIVTLSPNNNSELVFSNCIFGRNLLEPSGSYHWSFTITECKDAVITFGFMQNNEYIEGYALYPSDGWTKLDTFDVYLDADNKTTAYKIAENVDDYIYVPLNIDNTHNIRLYLSVDSNPATLEMIAFHDAKWYKNKLENKQDTIAHIGYARSIHDIHDKIKHYLISLKKYPLIASWNNEYLICLQQNKQYDDAYNHALKFKKGKNGITKLIIYYYSDDIEDYEKALSLLKLFDDETLNKMDLFFETAYCYNHIERNDVNLKKNALKYYELYYDQHQYDADDDTKEEILRCIGNMANIQYSHLDDDKSALPLFLKLPQNEIDRRDFNGNIGYCYWTEKDYKNALKYYELHLNKHPNDLWIHTQFYWTYHGRKEYDKANEYLLRGLNLSQNDKEKQDVYINLGVNAYWNGNIQTAIKYTKQALQLSELNVSSESRDVMIYGNLAKFYYKLQEYDESYEYILFAIKIDPNGVHVIGNYGIILYFMKRFDEAIVYLDKCIESKQKINDPELLPDCLYIYGQILYDKNKYNESINKCLKAINVDGFIHYTDKDKIYYLISINYEKLCKYEKSLEYILRAKAVSKNGEYQKEITLLQSKLNSHCL